MTALKKTAFIPMLVCIAVIFAGCNTEINRADIGMDFKEEEISVRESQNNSERYTAATKIIDVINDSVFGNYGRLLFPVNNRYYSGDTLGELRLTWYNNIDPNKTVEIANYMKTAIRFSTIFIAMRKKQPIPQRQIQACSFLKEIPGNDLQYAMQAADLLMWGQCTIVFPTLWNYRKWATTHLL